MKKENPFRFIIVFYVLLTKRLYFYENLDMILQITMTKEQEIHLFISFYTNVAVCK